MTGPPDPIDESIRELLQRSDGPVPLRPPQSTRAVRPIRAVVSAGLAVVLLVAALVGGNAIAIRRHQAAASPGPLPSSVASPSASAAVSNPPPAGALGPGFLVVDLGGHGIGVRTETDPTPFFRVENRTAFAVSGTRIAYWKTGPDDALPHELRVYDAASRSDRTLLTLTDARGGTAGFLVWSVDGQGIAFAVNSKESAFEGRLSPARPTSSALRVIDVATGDSQTLGSITGAWLLPLSWDRVAGIATATELGRDSTNVTQRFYEYSAAARSLQALRLPAPIDAYTIAADSGAHVAIGIERRPCGGQTCQVLWTWSLTDLYGHATSRMSTGLLLQAGFRPGTSDVYVVIRPEDVTAPYRIEDWGPRASRAAPRVVYSGSPTPGWFVFGADGSKLIVSSMNPSDHRGVAVDPDTLDRTPLALADDVRAALGAAAPAASAVPTFPRSWLLVGTTDGTVYRDLANGTPAGPAWKVCDGSVRRIVPAPGSFRVLVVCAVGSDTRGFLLDASLFPVSTQRQVRAISGPMSTNVAWSRDARSLIYTSIGSCEPPAPICKTRLWIREFADGEPTGTPRLLAEEYNLGEVRWTPLGPSVYKPRTSPNGIRQPSDAGTFIWNGRGFDRYSAHRLVDAITGGPALLEVEDAHDPASGRAGGVMQRIGATETRLTPADVADERALALLDDGTVLAWRPAPAGEFTGSLIGYRDGRVVRTDEGAFSSFGTFRAGIFGEWIIGLEYSGAPALTLRSYSIFDRTFAALPGGTVTAASALVVGPSRR